jgi:hypothetical protein
MAGGAGGGIDVGRRRWKFLHGWSGGGRLRDRANWHREKQQTDDKMT